MQRAPPILPLQALHRLDDGQGGRREAEILRRIEDTVYKQSKPLNQDPGGPTELHRQPTQVGGAGPRELKKQGVVGSFAPPPLPTAHAASQDHGGGRTSPPDRATTLATSAKVGDDEPSACGAFGPILLRFAGGSVVALAQATPTFLAIPTPTGSGPPPSAEASTASGVQAARVCRRTALPTTPAGPPPGSRALGV